MIASDFPITFGYGRTDPPYGTAQYPYHRGNDYYMPDGTPIVVNGVLIGLSGHSGFVTGPHCHVGKWVNGKDQNPNGQAWTLDNPIVSEVGYDDTNGYWVKLRDSMATTWIYLHMTPNSQAVKVGDRLSNLPKYKENNMAASTDIVDETTIRLEYNNSLFRDASPEEVQAWLSSGINVEGFQRNVGSSQEHYGYQETLAQAPAKDKQIKDLQAKVADLEKQLASATGGKVPYSGPALFVDKEPAK